LVSPELLIKYGFIKKDAQDKYQLNKDKGIYEPIGGKYDSKDADHEDGYPAKIKKKYRLSYEIYDLSLEEPYYWVLENLKGDQGDPNFEVSKIEDSFAASENSSYYGSAEQQLGMKQKNVSEYLATVGRMVKELFQIVRELRIMDERLSYYNDIEEELKKEVDKRSNAACTALKGMFVDLVQGGGKTPSSIYGMAQELDFITLPDLFFDAPPFKNTPELEKYVDSLSKDFNQNLLRVLKRHLINFEKWRERTYQEHISRRTFQINFLGQHYHVIQMYVEWLKPYLRSISRLTMKESNVYSPDLVSAFENSLIDIELMAIKKGKNGAHGCVISTFNYRTRADMEYAPGGYRKPMHTGKMFWTLRVYGWTKEQIENYKKMKKQEGLDLIGGISESVRESMKGLGDELEKYVREAKGEKEQEKKVTAKKKPSVMQSLFGDFYNFDQKKPEEKKSVKVSTTDKDLDDAAEKARGALWNTYKNFKKSHRMLSW
jgi:hypothetical protein